VSVTGMIVIFPFQERWLPLSIQKTIKSLPLGDGFSFTQL